MILVFAAAVLLGVAVAVSVSLELEESSDLVHWLAVSVVLVTVAGLVAGFASLAQVLS